MGNNKQTLKVGIVGLGRSGWGIHCKMVSSNSNYKITAVCDPDAKRLAQAKRELQCECYKDFVEFLKSRNLDVVIIASPSKYHYIMAKKSLKAGLHVVLDKPLAALSSEAIKLKKLAEKCGRILCPFYNFRFSREFLAIQDLLSRHIIGEIFLIRRQVGYFNRRDDWQSRKEDLGGILNAAAIHHVDQVIQLAGQNPYSVWCDLKKIVSKGNAPDHAKIVLKYSSGLVADIEVSWVQAFKGFTWIVYGSKGAIWKQGNNIYIRWFTESDVSKGQNIDRSYMSNERIKWKNKHVRVKEGFSELYYDQLAKAIRLKGALPVTVESAIASMKIIEKCEFLSGKTI